MPELTQFYGALQQIADCQLKMVQLTKEFQDLKSTLKIAVAHVNKLNQPTTTQERKGLPPKGAQYFTLGSYWKVDQFNRLMQHTGTAWVRSLRERKHIINKPLVIFRKSL
jgi:hypothetical protein